MFSLIPAFMKYDLFYDFCFSENTLDVTLWDALSIKFLDFYNNRSDLGPVVLIIKHARVKEAQGLYPFVQIQGTFY
jgi:hypothetical protein